MGFDGLRELVSCRLTEVPRPPRQSDSPADLERREAAITSAYHAGPGPLAMCWHRLASDGPVEVHVAGADLVSPIYESGQVSVTIPTGGRGTATDPGALDRTLREFPFWASIGIAVDPVVDRPPDRQTRSGDRPPSLEDCLLQVWHEPFTWLAIAEPVAGDELEEAIAGVSNELRRTAARSGASPEYTVTAEQLRRRHRELSLAMTNGLWRVRYAAGSNSAEGARRIAALVCASADLDQLPYTLVPARTAGDLDSVLDQSAEPATYVSSRFLAAIAAPPATEVPGLHFRLSPTFDVATEPVADSGGQPGVRLGTVLDSHRRAAGDLTLPLQSLNRHTFVCGATGAGKSQTVRGLLATATKQGIPWLVIEPAKAEYRLMASRLKDIGQPVMAIRPGDPDQPPAGLNPLEPAVDKAGHRFPLQTHLDLVRALFLAAFEADEPFPQVLSTALTQSYQGLGWDLALGESDTPGVAPRYPTLGDLQQTAAAVVDDIGYSQEITDNVRGFIAVRLSSLRLGTTGRFLEGGHQLDLDALLRSNVVFEIEDVGDDRDKAFLMGTVLIRLVEHLRLDQKYNGAPSGLRHLSVFEEAHRLLRNATEGPAAHAVEMFAGLLAEIRAYGEGLIIAEQIPSKLLPDVIKNTAVKIVHRLPAQDDRDAVGATMNLTEAQSDYLVTLPPGQAAVFTDGMDYPVLAAMPDGTGLEDPSVAPADAAPLISSRSITCGRACQKEPCTTRQIIAAGRTLRRVPHLALWSELAVVAHLIGRTVPVPDDPLLESFQRMDPRTRDCAIAHAVDDAVASRSTGISDRISPAPFADHVSSTLRAMISTGGHHIRHEPEWIALPYRWTVIRDRLARMHRDHPEAGRHPDSEAWERDTGRSIPGRTVLEQFLTVTSWVDTDQRNRRELRLITLGDHPEPPIAAAVGVPPNHPGWDQRLGAMLNAFVVCRWPLAHFATIGLYDLVSGDSERAGRGVRSAR
ncbi:ATP-binding protein [Microlunatus sp. GCM10028923]|uniref:ATP-binding protein n=1 Tax=Microlunatus sp. GCM10028923 TaxID=3273400 RepID=UPI00360818DB